MTPKTIAICGKGGVGKTTISAIAAKALYDAGTHKALIIDADPATGLSPALGMTSKKTLNDVRSETIDAIKQGGIDSQDLAQSVDYRLTQALTEKGNLAFLSIGRPEELGCFCSVHTLLRQAIEILSGAFDKTLIDAEAGVEQINREVMRKVDYLLLVSDPSLRGIRVAEMICDAAQKTYGKLPCGLLINRTHENEPTDFEQKTDLKIVGEVPEDDSVRRLDTAGRPYFELSDGPAQTAVIRALQSIGFF